MLADFGIARRAWHASSGEHLTEDGHGIGTPMYMAPEQAMAQPVDPRGRPVCAGRRLLRDADGTAAARGAHRPRGHRAAGDRGAAAGVRSVRPEAPLATELALERALSLEPDDRFAVDRRSSPRADRRRPSRAAAPAGAAAGPGSRVAHRARPPWRSRSRCSRRRTHRRRRRPRSPPQAAAARLAVLAFENLGDSADAYFADGMADEMRSKLAGLPGLEVIARGSSSQYRGSGKAPRPDRRGAGRAVPAHRHRPVGERAQAEPRAGEPRADRGEHRHHPLGAALRRRVHRRLRGPGRHREPGRGRAAPGAHRQRARAAQRGAHREPRRLRALSPEPRAPRGRVHARRASRRHRRAARGGAAGPGVRRRLGRPRAGADGRVPAGRAHGGRRRLGPSLAAPRRGAGAGLARRARRERRATSWWSRATSPGRWRSTGRRSASRRPTGATC